MIKIIITLTFYIFLLSGELFSANYSYVNERVQKKTSQSGKHKNKSLSNRDLSEVAYIQDEKISNLKSELIKSKNEQRKLKKELEELRKSFERFKTYYFRRY